MASATSAVGLENMRILVVLAVLLAACSSNASPSVLLQPLPSGRVHLASWPWAFPSDCSLSEAPPPTAGTIPCVVTGHAVEGRLEAAGGCVWVVLEGSAERRELRWPPGYSAQFDPLVLFDPSGHVVAKGGDLISADGFEPPDAVSGTCGGPVTDIYSVRLKPAGP